MSTVTANRPRRLNCTVLGIGWASLCCLANDVARETIHLAGFDLVGGS